MSRSPRRAAACSLSLLTLVAPPVASAGELGPPIATLDAGCTSGEATALGDALVGDLPHVVARVSAPAGPGTLPLHANVGPGGSRDTVLGPEGGEHFVFSSWGWTRGTRPTVGSFCTNGARAATVRFYVAPTAPVTFPTSRVPGREDEVLSFLSPSDAPYVADVQVSQGAVEFAGDRITGTATVELGNQLGEAGLHLTAVDGAAAVYRVGVRPLPITVSDVTAPAVHNASVPWTVFFSVDGTTTVNALLLDAAGRARRTLGAFPATSANRWLTMDGTDDDGRPLPDGDYTVVVRSRDPSGASTQAGTPIRLDSSVPSVTVGAPADAHAPVTVTASDPSGLRRFVADGRGGERSDRPTAWQVEVPAPSSGWTATSTVATEAEDTVGNAARTVLTVPFRPVAGPLQTPPGPGPQPPTGGPRPPKGGSRPAGSGPSGPSSRTVRLASVRARGVAVAGTAAKPRGTVVVRLRVAPSVARSLGVPRTIGSARLRAAASGAFRGRVRIARRVATRLRGRTRTTVRVAAVGGRVAPTRVVVRR